MSRRRISLVQEVRSRNAKPRRARSTSPSNGGKVQDSRSGLRRRVLYGLVALLAIGGISWLLLRAVSVDQPGDLQQRRGMVRRGPPPLHDPAAELGLSRETPQTIAGLKAEAIGTCDVLAKELPGHPEALAVKALTQMRFGLTAQAADTWRETLEIAPDFSPAHLGLGSVASLKGDLEEAAAELRKAVELNPGLEEAYQQLTEVLLRQGKSEEAISVAQAACLRFPESCEDHYRLGQAYLDAGRYKESLASHEAAVAVDPEFSSSYYSLGICCARLGYRDRAVEYRQRFANLKEQDLDQERGEDRHYSDIVGVQDLLAAVHKSAGDVCLQLGQRRRAEAHWLRGADVSSTSLHCRNALVRFYEQQDRPAAAMEVLQELIQLRPTDAGLLAKAGSLHSQLGEFSLAEQAFREAIQADANLAEAYEGLVQLHVEFGRKLPDAIPLAERAVVLTPTPRSYLFLSTVRREAGDRAGAIKAIEDALRLDPGNPQLKNLLEQQRRQ